MSLLLEPLSSSAIILLYIYTHTYIYIYLYILLNHNFHICLLFDLVTSHWLKFSLVTLFLYMCALFCFILQMEHLLLVYVLCVDFHIISTVFGIERFIHRSISNLFVQEAPKPDTTFTVETIGSVLSICFNMLIILKKKQVFVFRLWHFLCFFLLFFFFFQMQ